MIINQQNVGAAVEAIKASHPVKTWGLFGAHARNKLSGNLGGRPRLSAVEESRAEAMEAGLKQFSGTPCSKCGSPIRYVSNRACVHCVLNHARKQRERKNANS